MIFEPKPAICDRPNRPPFAPLTIEERMRCEAYERKRKIFWGAFVAAVVLWLRRQ